MKPSTMHNPEAERAVLASMLLRNGCIADVVRVLRSEDLYADAHQRMQDRHTASCTQKA